MTKMLIMAARVLALVALALGAAWWFGYYELPIHLHMTFGGLFVLILWALAFKVMPVSKGVAAGAFVLGLLLPVVGLAQLHMPIASAPWLLKLVHVVVALAAIGIAEAAAKRAKSVANA
ncbi:hypothetical protein NYQ83_10205 [Afifella sp. JA880]|uniref:hypothetical protein n=1 Tax=Afifella sp. JA880 TaxID=2975280 RepID=UPI0021BB96FF|nr:hypothetical protein [Afifella sp. JA880]MCT8267643.1 hypothetical protein [Afifella sp. JA880]